MDFTKLTKERALQILQDTIDYYRTHPRSVNKNGDCVYWGINNTRCAFSRLCDEKQLKVLKEGTSAYAFRKILGYDETDAIFYNKLQQLHDLGDNWTTPKSPQAGKLTEHGELKADEIKDYIQKNYHSKLPYYETSIMY